MTKWPANLIKFMVPIGNISLINPKEDRKAKIGFALFNKIALAVMPSIK
jgi:hypothetical protein